MNLIFIYGPPAAGKLTIAKELTRLTNYSLFHNHLTKNLVKSLYPDSIQSNYELVNKLRIDVFEYCAAHQTNLVFTFVYDSPEDDQVLADMVDAIHGNEGKVLFVELTAPKNTLLNRVSNDSRKLEKKLIEPAVLSSLLDTLSYSSVPYANIFKLDTSKTSPVEAANAIIQHYNLV